MNSLQTLCVLCSKLNECALELECLKYCDPEVVLSDVANFKKNGLIVIHLYKTLLPALIEQNMECVSPLSVYLEVLLKSMYTFVLKLDVAITRFSILNNRDAYYKYLLDLDKCLYHTDVRLTLSNGVGFDFSFSTLNDVERFLCKINIIYGLIEPSEGLRVCSVLIDFLSNVCGLCAVASPVTYVDKSTCLYCYEELSVLPNQGRSIGRRLRERVCDHITEVRHVSGLEHGVHVIEKDVLEEGINVPIISEIIGAIKSLFASADRAIRVNEAERILQKYNLFSTIPKSIYSLSDFAYWSKNSEVVVKSVNITMAQLNSCHSLYTQLQNELSRYMYGCDIVDVFTLNEKHLRSEERLFIGSVYASPCRVVDLIAAMSIRKLENNPLFSRVGEDIQVDAKLKLLISKLNDAGDVGDEESVETINTILRTHNLDDEINTRKRAYFQKVSEIGFSKVMQCVKDNESTVKKLISVNTFGIVIYDMFTKLLNGFISRKRWLDEFLVIDMSFTYDDHLYIKNNLLSKTLPSELLPILSQNIFKLINGPLIKHDCDVYPMPYNVNVAYACDNSEMLPHMKEDLIQCVNGTIHPEAWMCSSFNAFFDFTGIIDVNEMQKKMWYYVRELVLSVALYNDIFNKNINIYEAEEGIRMQEGIVLTTNSRYPLCLLKDNSIYGFKDLYLLLYYDLHGCEGSSNISEAEHCMNRPDMKICLTSLIRTKDVGEDLVPRCLFSKS